ENHSFSFSAHYSHGITAAIYHPVHRLLLVGGCESGDESVSKASGCGITAWRALSGSPHYKQTQKRGYFKMPSFRLFSRQGDEKDGVFRMSLSPDGGVLATEGRLESGTTDKDQYYPLVDVSWWSEDMLILARCSGSLTVSSVRSLRNLLGKSCEWFEPSPSLTPAHNGGFLSLESSAKARYFGYVKQGLYYATEMERFAPPRKRPRTVLKNYRLIDNEEYGEALSLAHAYNLDSDLVYQRQWRKSTVSIASIQDYLSKIRKRSWVLHECAERVPENVDATKELLQFGLKGTDLEALIAIGNREDEGRFILPGDVDLDDLPYEDILSAEEEAKMKKEREHRKRQELLVKVNFSRLTLEQKELCRSRLKLLTYLDRLATYEERYNAEFFKTFRSQNIMASARTYARESNVQALDILFTYHGSELLKHRLAILNNFPETTSPHEYTTLLPEA
ncbi:hypothetical protein NHX12_026786, partial [Muraenolepis orangiensis]